MVEPDQNYAAASGRERFSHSAVAAGIAWGAGDFFAAVDTLRELTGDIAGVSLASLEQTKQLIEDVREARHIDDLMDIQARYLTSWFQTLAEQSHRIGSFLVEVPRDMTQASRDMVEASIEAAQDIAGVTASGLAATAVLSQSAPPERSAR